MQVYRATSSIDASCVRALSDLIPSQSALLRQMAGHISPFLHNLSDTSYIPSVFTIDTSVLSERIILVFIQLFHLWHAVFLLFSFMFRKEIGEKGSPSRIDFVSLRSVLGFWKYFVLRFLGFNKDGESSQ